MSLVDSQALPKVKTDLEADAEMIFKETARKTTFEQSVVYYTVYTWPLWPALIFDSFR